MWDVNLGPPKTDFFLPIVSTNFSNYSVSEQEEKTETATEGMEISTRSKGKKQDYTVSFLEMPGLCDLWLLSACLDTGSTERMAHKRRMPSPSQSSNGHSSAETSPCPVKRKKKPGAVSSSKDQVKLVHDPYVNKRAKFPFDPVWWTLNCRSSDILFWIACRWCIFFSASRCLHKNLLWIQWPFLWLAS